MSSISQKKVSYNSQCEKNVTNIAVKTLFISLCSLKRPILTLVYKCASAHIGLMVHILVVASFVCVCLVLFKRWLKAKIFNNKMRRLHSGALNAENG